jgi:hypothetical protein
MSRSVYTRRLEDRIRELCAQLSEATDGEFEDAADELQSIVAEHILRMQNRTSCTILKWPEFPSDRRKADRK